MARAAARPRRIALDGALTLRTVAAAQGRIAAALAKGGRLRLDCAGLEEVDLAGAQLIVAALKTARTAGAPMEVAPPTSGALQRTLSRAGLVEAFESLCATGAASAETECA
ncbi:MAG TPA: STAS domain-containing protein [Caulobacteraceae bacterium]|nr:STAS domain-containing protein [Caulobacteraceae bacterium]